MYRDHSDMVSNVTWLSDGVHIVSGGTNHPVHVWNVQTGVTTATYPSSFAFAVSPDGKYLALSGEDDGSVQIWDRVANVVLITYQGHASHVGTLAWSPNGKCIASAVGAPPYTD